MLPLFQMQTCLLKSQFGLKAILQDLLPMQKALHKTAIFVMNVLAHHFPNFLCPVPQPDMCSLKHECVKETTSYFRPFACRHNNEDNARV